MHARWAMLGVAGVLVQEIVKPEIYFYEAGLPQNLPAPFTGINMGGLLAWEFILMHWVEVLRWQDYKNWGSVNQVRQCSTRTLPCLQRLHGGTGGGGQEGSALCPAGLLVGAMRGTGAHAFKGAAARTGHQGVQGWRASMEA